MVNPIKERRSPELFSDVPLVLHNGPCRQGGEPFRMRYNFVSYLSRGSDLSALLDRLKKIDELAYWAVVMTFFNSETYTNASKTLGVAPGNVKKARDRGVDFLWSHL